MTETPATPLVHAQNLRKEYGAMTAVDGVTFSIRRGECFGLLGPNGAGKTTTIRMLYGFTPRTSGSLELFGTDCDGSWRTIKSRIGVCQQDNTLDPDLSVFQNLLIFAGYFRISSRQATERAEELLHFFALEKKREAKVGELSGGLARRLTLARALINDPELIVLDEPTTGLDPQARRNIWAIIERLKGEGKTIVLTTHYMEEAEALSDEVCIMDHGRVIADGTPRELTAQLSQDTWIEFDAPDLAPGAWAGLAGEIQRDGATATLKTSDLVGALDALLRWSREKQVPLRNMVVRQPNLEDVFLSLTGRRLRE